MSRDPRAPRTSIGPGPGTALALCVTAAGLVGAGCAPGSEPVATAPRVVLSGSSPLVGLFQDAAGEFDVPAELLAGVAWAETGLVDRRPEPGHDASEEAADGAHAPEAFGVMGLPDRGAVRSIPRAAAELGVPEDRLRREPRENIRGAAALLRSLAPPTLAASGSRDRWLEVVERYFDAGAAGAGLALEVRRAIARGVDTVDDAGLELRIPSFAELYAERGETVGARRFASHAEYPSATWVAAHSSNYTSGSRGNADIDVVVIHTVQGSYAGAISWFQNPSANVSAHYVVRRRDGAITQMLHHRDVGWHAGNSSYNRRSIGIEHEGYVSDPANYTPEMLRASADLVRWLCDNLGIPKDRQHIIGHIEVPGATHTDPGPHWPWAQFMDMVRGGGGSMPPPAGTGILKGVVYADPDATVRLGGATVRVEPGGHRTSARANDGYWEFTLAPGSYTITAEASGYAAGQVSRTVTVGGDTWGSVGLTRSTMPGGMGLLRGAVYDARTGNLDTRIAGAVVRLSTGQRQTVDAEGMFRFELAPGNYTLTAEASGWQTATLDRTVADGGTAWGSVGLVPETATPVNRAPQVPALSAPIADVETRALQPIFTVEGVADPDGDAVSLEIEIYADEALSQWVSRGRLSVTAQDRIVSWAHPRDDLPRGARLFWRVRASDGQAESPWSAAARFRTPDGEGEGQIEMSPFEASLLAGVGGNAPPGAPALVAPADGETVDTARPRLVAATARDPEGDALAYQFQIASDDLFEGVEMTGPLVEDGDGQPAWVTERDLAPGSRYYARVRAADARVYGPWSAPVVFDVGAGAAGSGERPGLPRDLGGTPQIELEVRPDQSGCQALGGSDAGLFGLLAVGLVAASRRRRRAA